MASVSVASVRRVRIVAASGRRRGRPRRRASPAGREGRAGEERLSASASGQPQATFIHGGSNVGDRHWWRCVGARTAGRLERAWAGSARSGGSAAPAAVRGRAPSTACWCRLAVRACRRARRVRSMRSSRQVCGRTSSRRVSEWKTPWSRAGCAGVFVRRGRAAAARECAPPPLRDLN